MHSAQTKKPHSLKTYYISNNKGTVECIINLALIFPDYIQVFYVDSYKWCSRSERYPNRCSAAREELQPDLLASYKRISEMETITYCAAIYLIFLLKFWKILYNAIEWGEALVFHFVFIFLAHHSNQSYIVCEFIKWKFLLPVSKHLIFGETLVIDSIFSKSYVNSTTPLLRS